MQERSFDEILREKMGENSAKNSHSSLQEEPGWWTSISFERRQFKKSDGYKGAPQARQERPAQNQQTSENTEDFKNKKETAKESKWDFHQQLAIDQLIRLGAKLTLTSPLNEIKVAYRKLLRRYHPDLHQHLGQTEQEVMNERLQLVIESYRLLEN